MEYEFDEMMELNQLGLYYEAHCVDFDGECFTFGVYLQEDLTDEKFAEINKAVEDYIQPYSEEEIDLGYMDISKANGKVVIYLDLGNVEPENCDLAIHSILKALNKVSGIQSVMINENSVF